jgi:hypothetical protein
MAKRHRWDKSKRTTWPLTCLDCGCTGRVKAGTAGTMEYKAKNSPDWCWTPRATCSTRKKV